MKLFIAIAMTLIACSANAENKSGSGYPNPPEVYSIQLVVQGQVCNTICIDDPAFKQTINFDVKLDTCSDDMGEAYGKNCFGFSPVIEKEFSDKTGKYTYGISVGHYYNTSVTPGFKPLGYTYGALLDICWVPADKAKGEGFCTRSDIHFKNTSETNLFNSVDAKTAPGETHSAYGWVSKK